MNKEFIPYEQALELKELGFDEECLAFYHQNERLEVDSLGIKRNHYRAKIGVLAPLYSQAFRFFRENYTLFSSVNVDQTMEPKFCYSISRYEPEQFLDGWDIVVFNSDLYLTYEEAELECLKKLIEIAKTK